MDLAGAKPDREPSLLNHLSHLEYFRLTIYRRTTILGLTAPLKVDPKSPNKV